MSAMLVQVIAQITTNLLQTTSNHRWRCAFPRYDSMGHVLSNMMEFVAKYRPLSKTLDMEESILNGKEDKEMIDYRHLSNFPVNQILLYYTGKIGMYNRNAAA